MESTINNDVLSQSDIDKTLDELAAEPAPAPKKRVWEVDFLRGALILFVVWDHFMWDILYSSGGNYHTGFFQMLFTLAGRYRFGILRDTVHDTFVTLFVFLSGVSCSFSSNNGKRAIKMISFAMLLTAATYAASAIFNDNITIRFNVIHCIALSVLLWTCIDWIRIRCVRNWQKNVFGFVCFAVIIAVLVVGYYFKNAPLVSNNKMFFFLLEHNVDEVKAYKIFTGGDYLPFFPDFGWFLIGAFLGLALYKQKTTLFPSVNPKYLCPFTFCGRYSLWIYLGSQTLMYGIVYLLHGIIDVL